LAELGEGYHGVWGFTLHAFQAPPVYLALLGVATAWFLYIKSPDLPDKIATTFKPVHQLLLNKYGFDELYQLLFAKGSRGLGQLLWRVGDIRIIDSFFVNGSGIAVKWFSSVVRTVQSGFLYDYAFAMIIGLLMLLAVFVHQIF